MGCMSKKLKYQIMVFMITYLQVGVNSGYKAVVASCKSLQEMERPLQLDNQFFGWADFAFMLGLTIGAFALGHLGDYMDLRKYLLGYSLA
jgi:MFS family permease